MQIWCQSLGCLSLHWKWKSPWRGDICEETQGFEMQSRLSIHLKESSVVPFMPCSFLEAWHLGYLVMEMFWAGERRAGPGVIPSHTWTLLLCPPEQKSWVPMQLKERCWWTGCNAIYVLEDRLSGVSGLTLSLEERSEAAWNQKENASSCQGLVSRGGWADPTVWRCRARVNQDVFRQCIW